MKKKVRDHLRQNLGAFGLYLEPSYKPAKFHHEIMIPALEGLASRRGKNKLALFVPPGHAKTEWGTRKFVPWYLGNNPGHIAMTLSYSDILARDFGRRIRDLCRREELLEIFPTLELESDSRATHNFQTVGGNRYFATGFKGIIAGRRIDFLGIDDPVKSLSEARQLAVMKERFDVYRSVVDARLNPGGIVLMNLTRYCMGDFADMVMEYEGHEWEVITLAAENPDGTYLWEERFGRAHYEKVKQRDPEIWWSTWMQQPQRFHDQFFSPEWLNFYDPIKNPVPRHFAKYMFVDPALSTNSSADRTSIVVIAAGPERRLLVVDWVYDRIDPLVRADHVCRLVRKWQPRQLIYEELGLACDTFYLYERFKKERIALRVEAVGRRGPRANLTKQDRIRQLIPEFRSGRIWFPEQLMQKCHNGETIDVIKTFIEEEYIPYRGEGSVRHEDGLDSLSRIHEPEVRFQHQAAINTIEVRPQRDQRRGSWEAYI